MKYVGLHKQISRNNFNSVLLLIAFPVLLISMVYIITWVISANVETEYGGGFDKDLVFLRALPVVLGAVGIWFLIAWFGHSKFIQLATGSKPLERKENKRVYNLVENLCIQLGTQTPKIYVIEDDSLNAFASGISEKTYAISLSRGLINKLNDDELEGVIAHELTHIRNRDVRLLIVSIIFVGIFAFIAEMAIRSLRFGAGGRKKNGGYVILIIIVVAALFYLLSIFLRFGISRSREYLADAGAAEMTKKPYALANALRKIDADPDIEAVKSHDVAQLFIDNPSGERKKSFSIAGLFATHPPIQKRIELLDQFA